MQSLALVQELADTRSQIAQLQRKEMALRAALASQRGAEGMNPGRIRRPGWPIQRIEGGSQHDMLRT